MPAGTVTLKYVGGLDAVTVYCPTSGLSYHCERDGSIDVLAVTAAGLSPAEWKQAAKKKTAPKKAEA